MLRRAALAALSALAVMPSTAGAASVTLDATTIHFTADASSTFLTYGQSGASIRFSGVALTSFTGCTDMGSSVYTCPIAGRTKIMLDGGDAADFLFWDATPLDAPLSVTINGGKGNDLLQGANTSDSLNGGDGDDSLLGSTGSDTLFGGDGRDRADFSAFTAGVTATVGGAATFTGGNATLNADIEDIIGGSGDDTLTGNGGPNQIAGSGGNDTLDGAGGTDALSGGDGTDTINARDGTAESVDCGAGADGATVDSTDAVFSCETTNVSGALVPDADGDGFTKGRDCNDADPAVHPGQVEIAGNGKDDDCDGTTDRVPDADHDGFPSPADCNDANAAISPGAKEVRGNKVDENCDGIVSPFDLVAATLDARWNVRRTTTQVRSLTALGAEAGTTIKLTCRGKQCPFSTKTKRLGKASEKTSLTSFFKSRRLPARVRITVTFSKPARRSRTFRYDVARGEPPSLSIS